MLRKFADAKRSEIMELLGRDARGEMPAPMTGPRPSFSGALRTKGPGAVIAEYKRASPSKGVINLELTAADVARGYAGGGAACMSVLTEVDYFQGDLAYLDEALVAGIPLLRKDFILHPLQIRRTAATPASAVLLIARMVETRELSELLELCDHYGLEAVTEVFDAKDLAKAREAGARIIQVNNRDLDSLTISLDVSRSLIGAKTPEELWISASGIDHGSQITELASLGFDAVLIGTFLMEGGDPEGALKRLIKETDA
ncbi:indole-3-glycerol-phosphate synthase [Desulfovibrio ferrophilus]|uniref:indole-3-glycerol-phosphate synthase n=1 Tax=Desulfovibrio ferrophilus TaxID=241368 RepID=A0A2Z6B2V0_9BACT|nr:indole-3-glycerol-phosphate synthase [Desulfovibrio ferrophilus]BBD09740.1 indole-3-glycerol-phosphate synthase [Desulfovibrio ferrophilus]